MMNNKENYPGFRIRELWVFVSIDDDGDEGVIAAPFGGAFGNIAMPLIAADETRRAELEAVARAVVHVKGGTFECRKFIAVEDTP